MTDGIHSDSFSVIQSQESKRSIRSLAESADELARKRSKSETNLKRTTGMLDSRMCETMNSQMFGESRKIREYKCDTVLSRLTLRIGGQGTVSMFLLTMPSIILILSTGMRFSPARRASVLIPGIKIR